MKPEYLQIMSIMFLKTVMHKGGSCMLQQVGKYKGSQWIRMKRKREIRAPEAEKGGGGAVGYKHEYPF